MAFRIACVTPNGGSAAASLGDQRKGNPHVNLLGQGAGSCRVRSRRLLVGRAGEVGQGAGSGDGVVAECLGAQQAPVGGQAL